MKIVREPLDMMIPLAMIIVLFIIAIDSPQCLKF